MSTRYVNVDRQTPLLLAPDMREWLPKDDLAHFLIDALRVIDLGAASVNVRGTGSEQYPPGMMLVVLIYCYAQGIFSSRAIERATYQHLSVRYLTADTHPDHDTIATFRRSNGPLLSSVFVQVLRLAKRSGFLRLGTVAIDGTKLKAAAAKRQTLSRAQLEEELALLEGQVGELLEQAQAADAAAPQSGELPKELVDAQQRRARLLAVKEELDRQGQERAQAQGVAAEPKPGETINLSDGESTLTPTAQGGFIQGYNAQLALSVADGQGVSLIVAAEVVRDTSDIRQLEPLTGAVVANCQAAPATILVDTGYDNARQILNVEERHGCQVLCPPARNAQAGTVLRSRKAWDRQRWDQRQTMRARLSEPAQQKLYRRRGTSIEPAFGIIKNTLGFGRFRLRGLAKVRTEWNLVALAFNCRRLASAKVCWN